MYTYAVSLQAEKGCVNIHTHTAMKYRLLFER